MKHSPLSDHACDIFKGAIGVLSSVLGVLTSLQEQLEYYMRIASLSFGMIVAILTAISIVRGWRKK